MENCPVIMNWEVGSRRNYGYCDDDIELGLFVDYVVRDRSGVLMLPNGNISIRGTLHCSDRDNTGEDIEVDSVVEIREGGGGTIILFMTPFGYNRRFTITTRGGKQYFIETKFAKYESLARQADKYVKFFDDINYSELYSWRLAVDRDKRWNNHFLEQFIYFVVNGHIYADMMDLEIPARYGIYLYGEVRGHDVFVDGDEIRTSPIVYMRRQLGCEFHGECQRIIYSDNGVDFRTDYRWIVTTAHGNVYRLWETRRHKDWNDPLLVH